MDAQDTPPLTPELLLHGYTLGVFPMAEHRNDPEIFWVDPRQRGVLPLDGFHMSRSLARRMRNPDVTATVNTCFDTVLQACADRSETWINDEIAYLYTELHARGKAHSLEIWYQGRLAGGVYGVAIGAAFFGESMFSRERDGSKVALACLVLHLKDRGFQLFDTQFITDHLASLGAEEIPRAVYQDRLKSALAKTAVRIESGPVLPPYEVVQRMTQTSY